MQNPNRTTDDGEFSEWSGRFSITKQNLKDALQRIQAEYGLSSLEGTIPLLVSTVNRGRIDYLNEIVGATSTQTSACTQAEQYVFMSGAYVLLSDVLKCIRSAVRHVVVTAANRLFIDTDMIFPSLASISTSALTLIAPHWLIVGGNKIINISGVPGKAGNKNDGRPGLPGGNGGNFFGITQNVSGCKLHIVSNGGMGGAGHTGGHHQLQIGCESPFKETDKPCLVSCRDECSVGKPCDCSQCDYFCCSSTVRFIRHGKDGGQGGMGGNGGSAEIISTSTSQVPFGSVKIERTPGGNGSDGEGGKGKSTTSPPPESELSAAGITQINDNKQLYCVKSLSEILHPNPVAKDGGPAKIPPSARTTSACQCLRLAHHGTGHSKV